jgi:hypothetical protein
MKLQKDLEQSSSTVCANRQCSSGVFWRWLLYVANDECESMDRIVIDNLLFFNRDPTPLMVGDEDVCRCK